MRIIIISLVTVLFCAAAAIYAGFYGNTLYDSKEIVEQIPYDYVACKEGSPRKGIYRLPESNVVSIHPAANTESGWLLSTG